VIPKQPSSFEKYLEPAELEADDEGGESEVSIEE